MALEIKEMSQRSAHLTAGEWQCKVHVVHTISAVHNIHIYPAWCHKVLTKHWYCTYLPRYKTPHLWRLQYELSYFRKGIITVLEREAKKENRKFDYPFLAMCCSLLLLRTSVEYTHLQPKFVKTSWKGPNILCRHKRVLFQPRSIMLWWNVRN